MASVVGVFEKEAIPRLAKEGEKWGARLDSKRWADP
jgi:hypothetical protein